MRFTEEDIESKALQLAQAGVNQKDIETWIDTARKERELSNRENSPISPSNLADLGKISGNISNQLVSLANVGKMGAKMVVDEGPAMAARGAAIATGQEIGSRAPGALKAIGIPVGGAISAGMTDLALQQKSGQPYKLGQTLEEMAINK